MFVRTACGAGLVLALLVAGGPAEGGNAGDLPAGKVKLRGRYQRKQLQEGGKARTYFLVPAGGRMQLRAGGPTAVVVLARAPEGGSTVFSLQMDGARTARVRLELHSRVTRGFYLPVPAGTHDVLLEASRPVLLRPVRVKRAPHPDETVASWETTGTAAPGTSAKAARDSQEVKTASAAGGGTSNEVATAANALPAGREVAPPLEATGRGGERKTFVGRAADRNDAVAQEPAGRSGGAGDASSAAPVGPSLLERDGGKRSLLVMGVRAVGGSEAAAGPVTEALAGCLARYPGLEVTTMDDVRRLLSHEESRQLAGCGDDTRCMLDAGESIDSDWVLTGTLGPVGARTVLTLTLVDLQKATPVGRASETVDSSAELMASICVTTARLLGGEGPGAGPRFRLPSGQQVSLAVMDLKAEGLADELAGNLTQILSVEIKRIEGTSVISRDDVAAMLQLEESKAFLGCDDTSCMAEIGGALGVDKLVVGSAGKLANSYVITLRLIDVRNAKVDSRVTETFRGEEDQLIRAVRHAGRRLFGIRPRQGGLLAVSASQEGAALTVDGEPRGNLPAPPARIDASGRHLVRVSKDGFFDWQSEIYVDPGETTAVWTRLEERPEKWYQKWWVWTIVGVVVAGGATTAAILLQPDQDPGRGEVILP